MAFHRNALQIIRARAALTSFWSQHDLVYSEGHTVGISLARAYIQRRAPCTPGPTRRRDQNMAPRRDVPIVGASPRERTGGLAVERENNRHVAAQRRRARDQEMSIFGGGFCKDRTAFPGRGVIACLEALRCARDEQDGYQAQ